MAWTIDSFDGQPAFAGTPCNLRTAMFEFIRAIDERHEALYWLTTIFATQFRIENFWFVSTNPPTNAKQNPTIDDLLFLPCVGTKTGTNLAYRNMVAITDRIIDMLDAGRFVTASGGTTKYTQASMETAIGTTLEYPVSVTEARWWQSIHDALNLMIYAYSELVPSHGLTAGSVSDTYDTEEDAWDNRGDNPFSTTNSLPNSLVSGWSVSSGFTSAVGSGSSRDFYLSNITSSTVLQGVVEFAEYEYSSTWDSYTGSDFEVAIGADSINVTGSGSGTIPATPMTLGSTINKTATITTSAPASNPFNRTFPMGDVGLVNISITGLNVQHDLSTILTDQA